MCSIIGHRGAISYKPENTISSIKQLKEINCDWIEADVVLTKDKYPIMFHDKSLDRLTKSKGLIRDYNYDEIKDLNINNTNEKIPLLKDFIDKCCELSINIFLELKAYNNDEIILVNKVVEIIRNIKKIQIIRTKSLGRVNSIKQVYNLLEQGKTIRFISKQTGFATSSICNFKKEKDLYFEAFPILVQFKTS